MNDKEMMGLLEAKVAVVKLKHGIVRKWLATAKMPEASRKQQGIELDQLENQALVDLHIQFWKDIKTNNPFEAKKLVRWIVGRVTELKARRDIIKCLTAHDTQLVDSCFTETGYVHH